MTLTHDFNPFQAFCLKPATLLKKRLWHRYFPVNFAKIWRTYFHIEHLCWLLLYEISYPGNFALFLLIYHSNVREILICWGSGCRTWISQILLARFRKKHVRQSILDLLFLFETIVWPVDSFLFVLPRKMFNGTCWNSYSSSFWGRAILYSTRSLNFSLKIVTYHCTKNEFFH